MKMRIIAVLSTLLLTGCIKHSARTYPNNSVPANVVTVSISPAQSNGNPTLTVNFVGSANSSASIVSWTWNFGDGISCTSPNFCGLSVKHLYPKVGSYTIVLSATDLTGATGQATATVTVTKPVACGPPTYCAYTGTDAVQTPAALFSVITPANTVIRETVLSKLRWVRITDGLLNGTEWNATPSGGSYDVITNTNTTALELKNEGSNFAVGFNPNTMQAYPYYTVQSLSSKVGVTYVAGTKCPGAAEWSRADPAVWYCLPESGESIPMGVASGTMLYLLRFSYDQVGNLCGLGVGKCIDVERSPAWTPFFDFSTCTLAQSGKVKSRTILGIGLADGNFTNGISWTGNQGTAHLYFSYQPNAGCTTFDTQGNGINPVWYSPAGIANTLTGVNATWFLHDATTNGEWASFSPTNCVGADCTGRGPFLWQIGASNLHIWAAKSGANGHDAMGGKIFFNAGNPAINAHPFSALDTWSAIANVNCSPCQENHFSADVSNDKNPLLGTSAGPDAIWTAPNKNEILGFTTDGSQTILRFGKTYETGTSDSGFWSQYAIGAPSQDRKFFFLTSNMLCNLGKTAGVCQSDVFALDLTGQ